MRTQNKPTALFELIKSLKKSEKRYVKLYSAVRLRQEKSIYMELFDILSNQEEYNKDDILKKCKKIKPGQYANHKKYLYDLILTSLASMYAENDVEDKIKQIIRNVKTLFDKKLFDQCTPLLNRAKQLATKYERHVLLLEIIDWEIVLGMALISDRNPKFLFEEKEKVLNTCIHINNYHNLATQMIFVGRQERQSRHETFKKSAREIIESPLFKNTNDQLLSGKAFFYYHFALGVYYYTLADFVSSYMQYKILLDYMELHPDYIEANMDDYKSILFNLVLNSIVIKKYDDYLNIQLQKLKHISTEKDGLKALPYILELTMYIEKGDFENGLDIIKEAEQNDILKHKANMNIIEAVDLEYQICYIYYGNAMYQEALTWLNTILNREEKEKFIDLYCSCRIVQIIIHYELNNIELVISLIRSTYRFLAKKERLYKFEQEALKFFRTLLRKGFTKQELKVYFEQFYLEVSQLSDEEKVGAIYFFDFPSWLKSKITDTSFAEIVKEKFEKEKYREDSKDKKKAKKTGS